MEHGKYPQTVEAYLAEGVQAHMDGDFEDAISFRERAANLMSTNDPRYVGLQGTLALSYDRVNRHADAVVTAQSAYDMLYRRLRAGSSATAAQRDVLMHERPTVELHLGIVLARATARAALERRPYDVKQFTVVNKMMEAAHTHQQERRGDAKRPHQWDINMLRRRAGAIALDPEAAKLPGIKLGAKAVVKGVLSESPRYVDGTSNISGPNKYRKLMRAKTKAVIGGLAATAQCALSLSHSKPAKHAVARIAAGRAVF